MRDGRGQRRGSAPPFAGPQPRRQIAFDLRRPHGGRDREQSPRHRHVPPHQRLTVGDQPRPGRAHGRAFEHANPAVVALLGSSRRLPRGPFQQAGGQPARRQGAHRMRRQPTPLEFGLRHQGQRQSIHMRAGRQRQAQRERDSRPDLRTAEGARRRQRQGRGQRDKRGGIALVQSHQHATTELALLRTLWQSAGQFKQRRSRHGLGQKRQVIDQSRGKRRAHAGQQLVGGHAFEGRGLLIRGRGGQAGHALAPERSAVVEAFARMNLREPREIIVTAVHRGSLGTSVRPWPSSRRTVLGPKSYHPCRIPRGCTQASSTSPLCRNILPPRKGE